MKEIIFTSIPVADLEKILSKAVEKALYPNPDQKPDPDKNSKASENFATREEVAKALHISKPTLNQLTKEGTLQGYRLGGRVLYKWDEVNNALKKMKTS